MAFGLAELLNTSDINETNFMKEDLGELGYVAPEYSATMVASLKGDEFGFGVVLLELVTRQNPLEVNAGGKKDSKGIWWIGLIISQTPAEPKTLSMSLFVEKDTMRTIAVPQNSIKLCQPSVEGTMVNVPGLRVIEKNG
ncbi:hypothetical protein F3Y22_tig00110694pilonHSYRG00019 [Hibiscus syriacus]|uniref:Protein kinase domain-containing protein n=1 Tax=Hibiscus syriacus TaxID=106335 RepID=A0A6A2ZUP6_HIBSY|nr:hypothetical protein F3Y22_tig00110694pilonHSYRG00019 [Hibiscus syriacus]